MGVLLNLDFSMLEPFNPRLIGSRLSPADEAGLAS